MAKILFLTQLSNDLFNGLSDDRLNRDNYFDFLRVLKKRLNEMGHDIHASPKYIPGFDVILHEFYSKDFLHYGENKNFLFLMESPIVKPKDFDTENHKYFDKIFTWSDDLCTLDSKKYIKNFYCFDLSNSLNQ